MRQRIITNIIKENHGKNIENTIGTKNAISTDSAGIVSMHLKGLGTTHKCARNGWHTTTIIGMDHTTGTITTIQDFWITYTQETQGF